MYAAANDILGNIVKVTPSSKVVGDLALHLVGVGADPAEFAEDPARFDIPDSVIGFLNGELGDPPGGWPEPFRTKALEGRTWKPPAERADRRAERRRSPGRAATRRARSTSCCSPARPRTSPSRRETYGDVSVLPTLDYLYGLRHGEEHEVDDRGGQDDLILGLQAISEPDERGFRTVMATINGQLRPINVRDRSVAADVGRGREGRPRQARPRRGAVPGRRHVVVEEGDRSRPARRSRPSRR